MDIKWIVANQHVVFNRKGMERMYIGDRKKISEAGRKVMLWKTVVFCLG